MKISFNLATLRGPRERYALAWALPVILIGTFAMAAICYAALNNFREYRNVESHLNVLLQKDRELRDRENALRKDLDQPQQLEMFQKARYVNGLIERKKLSLATVTEKVSKILPPSVRLASMGLARPKNDIVVSFSVVGHDQDGLETFMEKLEDSPDFKDLAISNQGIQQSSLGGGQVSIICTATYVGDGAN